MERLTGPLAEFLARHREACNNKFAVAKQKVSDLDGAAFLEHLATTADPIVRAVAGSFAERADTTAMTLYDLSLELFMAGLIGPAAKTVWISEVWRRLLPELPVLMAREPRKLTACASNAVTNISATPGTRPGSWIEGMLAVGPQCADLAALIDCGKVLAWRAGMAQHRFGALAAARGLPAKLAGMALGLSREPSADELRQAIEQLEQDPWLKPEQALSLDSQQYSIRLVARAGAFRGFGGPFLRPPTLFCSQDGLIAFDGEGQWRILADACGVVCLRDDHEKNAAKPTEISVDNSGKVSWDDQMASFPDLREPLSQAGVERTFAVTIATSHHVFLLAKSAWGL